VWGRTTINTVFSEEIERSRTLGILLPRREDNIKIHLMEKGQKVVDWIRVAQDSVSTGPL